MSERVPPEIAQDLARIRRLSWWTIGWMISIIIVMGLVMGSSQAMMTAWVEDVLSMIPAIVLLVSLHFEYKEPDSFFRFGYDRVHSLGFLISAVALSMMGGFLLFDSAMTLITREHVTIPSITLFGAQFWMGWLMIAALLYSVVPPLVLGRMKLPIAQRTSDEVLHTDAMMQRADWMTGLAGAAGVLGVGLGFWWADAAAAGIISLSILHDGVRALRVASGELMDAVPRALGSAEMADDAAALSEALAARWPGSDIRLRESGRYIMAQVRGVAAPDQLDLKEIWPGDPDRGWRLSQISFVPPQSDARP